MSSILDQRPGTEALPSLKGSAAQGPVEVWKAQERVWSAKDPLESQDEVRPFGCKFREVHVTYLCPFLWNRWADLDKKPLKMTTKIRAIILYF